MRPLHAAALLGVMVIWGLNFAFAKIALAQFPPLLLTSIRFAIASLLLVPFVRMPRGQLFQVFLVSVTLGTIHFPMMFTGLTRVDAATASVAIQVQVPFAAILAAAVFGDRLGWRRALGMAIAFAGLFVIAGEPRMTEQLGYLGLVVAASFVWAVSNVQIKRLGAIDGFALTGWMALMAAPQLLVVSLLIEDGQLETIRSADWRGWGAVLFMSVVVTVLSYAVWYPLVRRYDVNQTMPWTLSVPVFGVLSGVLILDEPLTLGLLLGGALTLAGVAIIVLRRPKLVEGRSANPA